MPEEQDAMGSAQESGPVDDIGCPALDRFQEPAVLLRIVLQVRVLHGDNPAPGMLKARPEACALAPIPIVEKDTESGRR